jgi:hypothetical protein
MCGSTATSDFTATTAHGFFPARRLVSISSLNLRAGKKLWAARGARGNTDVRATQNGREVRGAWRVAPTGSDECRATNAERRMPSDECQAGKQAGKPSS